MIPIEKLRAKLQALYWAEIHMREARDTAAHLMAVQDPGQELRHCIYTGIVVSYSRSFGANQGLSFIGSKFGKFTNPRLQSLHDLLLEARSTIYAHKDVEKEGDRLAADSAREALGKIRLHVAPSGQTNWVVHRPSLPPEVLKHIIALCSFQIARLNEASTEMLASCFEGKSYEPGDYVLGESFP